MREAMNTFEINDIRLMTLGIHGEGLHDCRRSLSSGFMGLVVERLAHLDSQVTTHPGVVVS